jgi:hypothetical protein
MHLIWVYNFSYSVRYDADYAGHEGSVFWSYLQCKVSPARLISWQRICIRNKCISTLNTSKSSLSCSKITFLFTLYKARLDPATSRFCIDLFIPLRMDKVSADKSSRGPPLIPRLFISYFPSGGRAACQVRRYMSPLTIFHTLCLLAAKSKRKLLRPLLLEKWFIVVTTFLSLAEVDLKECYWEVSLIVRGRVCHDSFPPA